MISKIKGKGSLEVICGSMFSGKSEELIRRLKRAEYAKLNVLAFKHSFDNRKTTEYVMSHNGSKIKAFATADPKEIYNLVHKDLDVIGIDEIQFYPMSIVEIVLGLVDDGKNVIVAGLDLDFRGIPFGPMPALMAFADDVSKLNAVCIVCGKDAHHTQRIVNNKPAKFSDPIVLIGAEECYQARCRDCYQIDKNHFTEKEI